MQPNDAHDDAQEIAHEFMHAFGTLSAELANFAVLHVDDQTRCKLERYKNSAGFALAVSVEMAPSFKIRLLATANQKAPFAVFELYPTPAPLH